MISIATLTNFLGWCLALNVVVLIIFVSAYAIIDKSEKGFLMRVITYAFAIPADDIRSTIFSVFQAYRVLFIFFNIVPYTSLRLMA